MAAGVVGGVRKSMEHGNQEATGAVIGGHVPGVSGLFKQTRSIAS